MVKDKVEARLRILYALANADDSLTPSEIAKEAGVSKQVVGYWIPRLIASGLVLPLQTFRVKKYLIQPVLVEFNWTPKKLRDMMEPLVKDADLTHVDNIDDAILNIATIALDLYGYIEDEDEGKEGS